MAILDSLGTTRSQLWSIEKIEVTKNDDTETFYYLIPENPSTESTVVKLDPNDQSGSTTTYGTLKEELETLREQDNTTVSVDTFSENLRVFQKNGKIYFKNSSGDTIYTLTTNLNDEVTLQEVSDSSSLDDDTSDGTLLGSLGSIFNGSDSFGTSGREYSVYELNDDNETVVIVPKDPSSNSTAFIYNPETGKITGKVSVSTLKNYIKENDLDLDLVLEDQYLRKRNDRIIFVDKDGDATRLVRNIEGDLDPQDLETVGDTTLGGIFGGDNDLGGIFDGGSIDVNSPVGKILAAASIAPTNFEITPENVLKTAAAVMFLVNGASELFNGDSNNSTVEEEGLVPTVTETPTETPTETASTETTGPKVEEGTGIILLTPEEYEKYLASGGAAGSSGNDPLPPSVLAQNTVEADPKLTNPAQTPAASTPTATPTPKPNPEPAAATPETKQNNNKQTVAAASESKTKQTGNVVKNPGSDGGPSNNNVMAGTNSGNKNEKVDKGTLLLDTNDSKNPLEIRFTLDGKTLTANQFKIENNNVVIQVGKNTGDRIVTIPLSGISAVNLAGLGGTLENKYIVKQPVTGSQGNRIRRHTESVGILVS